MKSKIILLCFFAVFLSFFSINFLQAEDAGNGNTLNTSVTVFNLGILLPEPVFVDLCMTFIDLKNPNSTYSFWTGLDFTTAMMKYEIFMESLFLNEKMLYLGGGGGSAVLVTSGFTSFKILGVAEAFVGLKLTESMNIDARYKMYIDLNGIYTTLFLSCGMAFGDLKPYADNPFIGLENQNEKEEKGIFDGVAKMLMAAEPERTPVKKALNAVKTAEKETATKTYAPVYTSTATYTNTYTSTFTQTATNTFSPVPTATTIITVVVEKIPAVKKNIKAAIEKQQNKTLMPVERVGTDRFFVETDLMSITRSIVNEWYEADLRAGFGDGGIFGLSFMLEGILYKDSDNGYDFTGWIAGLDIAFDFYPFGNSPSGIYIGPIIGGRYHGYNISDIGGGSFFSLTPGVEAGVRVLLDWLILDASLAYTANIYFYEGVSDMNEMLKHDYLARLGVGVMFYASNEANK